MAAVTAPAIRESNMRALRSIFLLLLGSLVSSAAAAQSLTKVPTDVILVKGAWSSASDSVTPLPEGGKVTAEGYDNPYFGLTLGLPAGWTQKYEGPPPSDSGYYVLAQLRPADPVPGQARGTLLIAAQDMFFTTTRATGALELINYTRDHLQADYRVERQPVGVTIAGRSFVRLDYGSPVSDLHWSVLATQIRCHVVEFIFTSTDTRLVGSLARSLNSMKARLDDGAEPVCVKDYARAENLVETVDPVFSEQKYNTIPVRLIIDREGKVKHIHFLSAFPAQAQAISAAVSQWRFKPYLRNGQPVEVETGILFGRAPRAAL
ncbi:MAG: hypothetical protein JWL65_2114 [Gammaproteobacteria bacterium]|nr:hypothetical protein [Gammaproteobacteria bacterium]